MIQFSCLHFDSTVRWDESALQEEYIQRTVTNVRLLHFDDHMVLLVERKADKEKKQNEGYDDKACEDIVGKSTRLLTSKREDWKVNLSGD